MKPENILVDDSGKDIDIRIADFGFAVRNDKNEKYNRCGTPGYIAPCILDGSPYTPKVDIFSVGVIIYNIFSGK